MCLFDSEMTRGVCVCVSAVSEESPLLTVSFMRERERERERESESEREGEGERERE